MLRYDLFFLFFIEIYFNRLHLHLVSYFFPSKIRGHAFFYVQQDHYMLHADSQTLSLFIINTSKKTLPKIYRISFLYRSSTMSGLQAAKQCTRHNSNESIPTSNLVCLKEVAIRTTLCIAGLIYYMYTCNLVTGIQCTRNKNAFNKRF